MALNSRSKGKRGELEFAVLLRNQGYAAARRGQQFSGSADSADVVGIAGVHFEVKYTERFGLYDAIDQARKDAGGKAMPVVAHRCKSDRKADTCRGDWLFVLGADDFFRLLTLAGYNPPDYPTLEDFM